MTPRPDGLPERHIDVEDTLPDPVDLPMEWDGVLGPQEWVCVCGMPCARYGGKWGHTRMGCAPGGKHRPWPRQAVNHA